MGNSVNMRASLLIALTIIFSAVARGTTVDNDEVGYSFDLPAGWIAIPSNEIYRTMNQVSRNNGAQSFSFCAGYQRDSGGRYFLYPYALIQVIPYPDGQSINSVSEADLRKAVASLTGASEQDMRKGMSDTAANLVQNMSIPTASYFTSPPGYRAAIFQSVAGIGRIHGEMKGLVGRDHIVSINFYARESDWAQVAPAMQQMTSSFHLKGNQPIALAQGVSLSPVVGYGIAGALIGATIGVVAYLKKKQSS